MNSEKNPVIDIVIPAHQKDVATLDYCIAGIRKNIVGVRRIIVVSKEKYTDKAEWFNEALYPFSFKEISDLVGGSNVGWNYQQLLKLYAVLVIPDISENVLIVDSDTVFYRKVKFFDNGIPLYNLSKDQNLENSDFHQTTFKHIKKILPEIVEKFPAKFENVSGICHHMLFQKKIIQDLFARVEAVDGSGDSFYKIFLKTAENSFGVAEYNLYFYFLISGHLENYKIRILNYKNTAKFQPLKECLRRKYDYCSYHSYMRGDEKTFGKKILNKITNIFFLEQWNIGILNFSIQEILQKKAEIKWLPNPIKSIFYADPFGFEIDGKKMIIFEDYSKILRRGRIAIAEFDGEKIINKKIILDDKKHLSYPFVIHHEGLIYMICESVKARKLILFEIDKKTFVLKKIREIFSDKKIIDPTLFFHKNKFWLFYTTGEEPMSKLHIAFSDSLFGEFTLHPKNPVKNDLASSRPAGTMFERDGKIYRPTQNCSNSYGGSIVINCVTELSEENFSEEFVKEIKPDAQSEYPEGIHTISEFGNLTLIDGRRKVFVIYKPLLLLIHRLTKIFL